MRGPGKPALIWSPAALRDFLRLRGFIEPHSPNAARRAAETLRQAARLMVDFPLLGKPVEGRPDRELAVPFSQSANAGMFSATAGTRK